jgi:hypothetical protein
MHPSGYVLKAVSEFPATKVTLAGIAVHHGALDGEAVVDGLISERRLVMIGERKAARYCLPERAPRNRKSARRARV